MISVTAIDCLRLIVYMLMVIFCICSRSLIIRNEMIYFMSNSLLVYFLIIKIRKRIFQTVCVMILLFNCAYVYKTSTGQAERWDFSFARED
ncbi:hypothetical protein VIGAN_01515700 [Vigna angularis var. angularis]|uniref:Uncharacterized protein n=1 Tax=Vigna angularis var. angularis TaxID=157739 RepID=A0A0S3R913_PHAAN|nr:hypothetical protein VIGAN_01515700 [Vigna angularis var. angularis]